MWGVYVRHGHPVQRFPCKQPQPSTESECLGAGGSRESVCRLEKRMKSIDPLLSGRCHDSTSSAAVIKILAQ